MNSIWKAALSDLTGMHDTTIAQLSDHKLIYELIFLIRIRLDAAYEVGLAFIDFLDQFVQGILLDTNEKQ